MSTKNSELLSFGEKTNSTSKSRAAKISIKVVLVSSSVVSSNDVTKGHTQAIFLVPIWCKTLKLEQTPS